MKLFTAFLIIYTIIMIIFFRGYKYHQFSIIELLRIFTFSIIGLGGIFAFLIWLLKVISLNFDPIMIIWVLCSVVLIILFFRGNQ